MPFSLDITQKAVLNNIKPDINSVLDIGSGDGKLLSAIKEKYPASSLFACDYTDKFIKINDCTFNIVDLNNGRLPWSNDSFDLVTITEVVEHLENYHAIIREIYRVLTPQGQVIITTPNILNLKSRMSYFQNGFWNLFGPLPLDNKSLETAGGHITPVHYFHLSYALTHAGFTNIELKSDKTQTSSLIIYALFFPFLWISKAIFLNKEVKKYKTVNKNNIRVSNEVNSFIAFTSRSIVVTAKKQKKR